MKSLFFLMITICINFGATASVNTECLEEITFRSHTLEQESDGKWLWRSASDTSKVIYFEDLTCVEGGFTPRLPPFTNLPNLVSLGHFSDQVNYGVEELFLPNLTTINSLLISSASYPNLEIKTVDLSSLAQGNLLLSAGNLAPNLEVVHMNRTFWENLPESDGKISIENHCVENTDQSSDLVIYFECHSIPE